MTPALTIHTITGQFQYTPEVCNRLGGAYSMLDRHTRPLHLILVIVLLGVVLVGCPPGGGGDEGRGEEGVGEGASEGEAMEGLGEGVGEGSGEGEPPQDGIGEGGGCGGCQTETFILPGSVELEMVGISAGTFMMGSNNGHSDETPIHEVTLTQDFQLGKFEVTKAQWEAVMGTTPEPGHGYVLGDPNSPMTQVSWDDAQSFVTTLNGLTDETFRLPTEAEWEYACRAGSTTEYYFGDSSSNLSNYAWWDENANGVENGPAPVVGQLLPNAFGLYDMHGNVWEWCEDLFGREYYSSSPTSDPTGPTSGDNRVARGGSWSNSASLCRSAYRGAGYQEYWSFGIGFRLARSSE